MTNIGAAPPSYEGFRNIASVTLLNSARHLLEQDKKATDKLAAVLMDADTTARLDGVDPCEMAVEAGVWFLEDYSFVSVSHWGLFARGPLPNNVQRETICRTPMVRRFLTNNQRNQTWHEAAHDRAQGASPAWSRKPSANLPRWRRSTPTPH